MLKRKSIRLDIFTYHLKNNKLWVCKMHLDVNGQMRNTEKEM